MIKLHFAMFACAIALCTQTLIAASEIVNGITWTYKVANGVASVGGGSSSTSTAVSTAILGSITIPSELGGKSVTSIGYHAFFDCSRLTNMTIPDSVTSIGDAACAYCLCLTSVTIPNGVRRNGGVRSSADPQRKKQI